MCGRFDTSHLSWQQIHDQLSRFANVSTSPLNIEPNDDVRPTTRQMTARLVEGSWVIEKMRWGLVPFWRSGKPLKDTEKGKGDGFKLTTFNGRCETVSTSAVFKGAFARRRCVVPASAWYEWTGEKGAKEKWRFSRTDGAPVFFAGIWDQAETTDDGKVDSFTILTMPSGGPLERFHDRAPVILDPDEIMPWVTLSGAPEGFYDPNRCGRFEVERAA